MTTSEFPFEVELHDQMLARFPGKMPETVLTIEKMIFSYRICEYTDPLFISRGWWYETADEAIAALVAYLSTPGWEPDGWLRADGLDEEGRSRIRRAHVVDGERVIDVYEDQ